MVIMAGVDDGRLQMDDGRLMEMMRTPRQVDKENAQLRAKVARYESLMADSMLKF